MFKWLNKQGVESDAGFVVQVTDRFLIEYREGIKMITVDVEPGVFPDGKFCVIISEDSFCKWDGGFPIAKEKQAQILKNFTEAMEFQNVGVEVY